MKTASCSNLTHHARFDRMERLSFVADRIYEDKAEIFCIKEDINSKDTEYVLYNNGALIVRNSKTKIIVTGFMSSVHKAYAIYNIGEPTKRCFTKSVANKINNNYELAIKLHYS